MFSMKAKVIKVHKTRTRLSQIRGIVEDRINLGGARMNTIVDIYKTASSREQFELNYIRETYRDFIRSNLLSLAGIGALIGYSGLNIEHSLFRSILVFVAVVFVAGIGIFINFNYAKHFENLLNSFNSWLVFLVEIEKTKEFSTIFTNNCDGLYKRMTDHIGSYKIDKEELSYMDKCIELEYETKQSNGSSGRFYINQAKAFIWMYLTILILSILALLFFIYQFLS